MNARIPAPSSTPRRLQPELVLPPYRYVPGRLPHPSKHPDGHAHGAVRPSSDAQWGRCGLYRFGIDLFDARYLWEAHEMWEERWRLTPRDTPLRWHLQGLIQVAACLLKRHQGQQRQADRLQLAALDKLQRVRDEGGARAFGLDLDRLRADLLGGGWFVLAWEER